VPSGLGIAAVETLMTSSGDEPFTEYCLLCETIEVPADRSWVAFNLNPAAKFHDGTPFNAAAVKANFDRVRNPDNKLRRYTLFQQISQIDVIDEAASKLRVAIYSMPEDLKEKKKQLTRLQTEEESAWQQRDYERAAEVKSERMRLEEQFQAERDTWKRVRQ
jgi:hypothetical protein